MLFLLPRDMAKIGYLYLRHGEWEGRRLLPTGSADVLSDASVDMHALHDPNERHSNLFWVFPDRKVYMATGWHGQLIAVFPDLDIVAVTTARNYVPFRKLIDGVSAAVKSESALSSNADAAEALANAIKDAAVEKPTAIGARSEMACAISGKTYKFPDNDLGLRSLTLFLTDARPHIEYELYSRHPADSSITYELPIGLDGLYRKGSPTLFGPNPGHVPFAKGKWLNGQTFEIDVLDLGFGAERKLGLSFGGETLSFRYTNEQGKELLSIDGKQGD